MNSRTWKRAVGTLTIAALLGAASAAHADARSARRCKIAGIVLASIAGTVGLASLATGGASYYYNTDNHWKNGHDDTGPFMGGMSAGLALAAGAVASIGLPLAIVGSEREKRAAAASVQVSLSGLSGRF